MRRVEEIPTRAVIYGRVPLSQREGLWLGSTSTASFLSKETMNNTPLEELLRLSHEIGREDRRLAILGEGNTSALISDDEFLVKASGSCLENLQSDQVTRCLSSKVLT